MVQRSRKKEKRLNLLLHPLRREIYRLVCETPGVYFFELSSALTAPHGTVNWHLRKLEEASLINSMKFGGKRVYYSRNLRSKDVEKAFVVLKHITARKVFAFILNNENCHQTQIAKSLGIHHDTVRHHTLRMEQANLVESFKNGRKTCYKLGEIGIKLQEESLNTISNTYIAALMDILEENCLHPEIEEMSKDHLTIRIECPGSTDASFTISLDQWSFGDEDEIDSTMQEREVIKEET
ncbi:MAG: helix-turn-helix domain-containing protein [Candidatus Heimdallarchaeota archaeon]|nr:helix-turn-helix domain-containing protein [Candidatus Heimdallarchaeota archaeon]